MNCWDSDILKQDSSKSRCLIHTYSACSRPQLRVKWISGIFSLPAVPPPVQGAEHRFTSCYILHRTQFKEQNTILHRAPTSSGLRLLCTVHCGTVQSCHFCDVQSHFLPDPYSATIRFTYLYIFAVKVEFVANDNFIRATDFLMTLLWDEIN